MIGWGAAWIVGFAAIDLLEGGARLVVIGLACALGMLLSWVPRRTAMRTGTEARMRAAWTAVLLASPFVVSTAGPPSFVHGLLLVSAIWALAMCLYGIATRDTALAMIGAACIVLAGVFASDHVPHRTLWFGLSAGALLAALGMVRCFHRVRDV